MRIVFIRISYILYCHYSMKKIILLSLLSASLILVWCWSQPETNETTNIESTSHSQATQKETEFISIKYRFDLVDVAWFEYLNTSSSSLVRWSWYDSDEQYMIINLNGVNYHYCEFPSWVRDDFKYASSFGTYYNRFIKWNYDCRINYLPSY